MKQGRRGSAREGRKSEKKKRERRNEGERGYETGWCRRESGLFQAWMEGTVPVERAHVEKGKCKGTAMGLYVMQTQAGNPLEGDKHRL